jgi:hypothetical protein
VIPVLQETIAECAVCGEIACERDLLYLEADEADDYGLSEGDVLCRECAELDE